MAIVQILLGAILIAIVLFNGEVVHQILKLREELRPQDREQVHNQMPPREPAKARKPAVPRI